MSLIIFFASRFANNERTRIQVTYSSLAGTLYKVTSHKHTLTLTIADFLYSTCIHSFDQIRGLNVQKRSPGTNTQIDERYINRLNTELDTSLSSRIVSYPHIQ